MTIRHRVRVRFRKEGNLRLLSHRDLVRTMERLFRRAQMPLGMSEGFHPKPRMSFPLALAVGIASSDEVMELELTEELSGEQVQEKLAPHLPPGFSINRVEVMPAGQKKAAVSRVTFEIGLPSERQAAAGEQIAALLGAASHVVQREEGKGKVDLRPYLDSLELIEGKLQIRLRVTPMGTARPREVLTALGLADLEPLGFCLSRTAVELETPDEKVIA